jgi:hypothetical protein
MSPPSSNGSKLGFVANLNPVTTLELRRDK